MMNKDANLMKGYLNTGRAERDATADGTQELPAMISTAISWRLPA
jgi:hypothetical protein